MSKMCNYLSDRACTIANGKEVLHRLVAESAGSEYQEQDCDRGCCHGCEQFALGPVGCGCERELRND